MLHAQQAEATKLDADTYLRQAQRGRQVSANLLARRSASEGGKELGYGG
jgi:hypothetical protein